MNIIKNLKQFLLPTILVTSGMTISAFPVVNEGEINVSSLWTSQIESYQREGENRVADLRRIEDGSYVGVYNSGAEALVQEGRLTHLTVNGEVQWDIAIQPGVNSSADRLAVSPEGESFVLGTTMVNNVTLPYLASVNKDGIIEFIKIIETSLQNVAPVSVTIVGKEPVVTYSGRENALSNMTIVLEKFDISGNSLGAISRLTEQSVSPLRPYYLNGFLMVPFMGDEAIAFNLEDMTETLVQKLDGGKFHNGCVSGDFLYNLSQNNEGMAEVTQYKVVDGALKQSWTLTTGQYWKTYNMTIFPVNNSNVALYVNRLEDLPGMTVISNNGEIIEEQVSMSFDYAKNIFVHSVGQTASGEFYMLGQKTVDYSIQTIKVSENLTDISTVQLEGINKDYIYFYLNSSQQYFSDGRFMIAGSMRANSSSMSYTTFFTEVNVDKSLSPQWSYTCSPGKFSDVSPLHPVADNDGNCYLYYRSYYDLCFAKFDSQGNFKWEIKMPGNCTYLFTPLILGNGNIIIGGAGYDNTLTLMCVAPDGETVFTRPGETGNLSELLNIMSILDKNGDITVCFAGRDETYACKLYIAKYDNQGECLSKKLFDTDLQGILLTGITMTPNGNTIVFGQGFDNNWIAYPCVASLDSEFNLNYIALSNSSELQGSQYREIAATDDRVFLLGSTSTQGFADIYSTEGKLEHQILYGEEGERTLFEGVTGNADGGITIVGERLKSDNLFEGFILSMDQNGDIVEKGKFSEDEKGIYLLRIFEMNERLVLVGACQTPDKGFQNLVLLLDNDYQILSEGLDPEDGFYLNYTFNGATFADGRVYISSTESIGISSNGFVSCFEISGLSGIENIPDSDSDQIDGEAVYYTLQGIRVSNPTQGIFIRHCNGKTEKVLIRR